MFVFVVRLNRRCLFLGFERRRNYEEAPKWGVFGGVFPISGGFFAKSGSFFAKIERNGAVFANFEKGWVVIALILATEDSENFYFAANCTNDR